jgi:hypothetical protein
MACRDLFRSARDRGREQQGIEGIGTDQRGPWAGPYDPYGSYAFPLSRRQRNRCRGHPIMARRHTRTAGAFRRSFRALLARVLPPCLSCLSTG